VCPSSEFVVALTEIAHRTDVDCVAKRLLAVMSESNEAHGQLLAATVSTGITLYPKDGEDAKTLLKTLMRPCMRQKSAAGISMGVIQRR
jgi:GGDEF domain-containing protein